VSADPLADVLRATADMDTSMQTWEYDFERLARAAREHIAAEIKAIPQRPWDENDADSAEARSARAYGSGLADAARIARGQS
jgi:hypothetical protein